MSMPNEINTFKSKFSQWVSEVHPNLNRATFKASLNTILEAHIPDQDQFPQFIIRDLLDSKDIDYRLFDTELLVFPYNSSLFVATIMPSWDRGLKKYCRNEDVYDVISWFFHYASQYVARSRMINIISALCLARQRTCDFRGFKLSRGPVERQDDFQGVLKFQVKEFLNIELYGATNYDERDPDVTGWIRKTNALDPFINRAVFQFINATKLHYSGFAEECITSLDKTVDIAHQYARARMHIINDDYLGHREAFLTELGFNDEEQALLKLLYKIRNFFGGHASISKWWDFSEMFDTDIDDMLELVRSLLGKLIAHEEQNRIIEKNPSQWSNWFFSNVMLLWDSVWFDKVNKFINLD